MPRVVAAVFAVVSLVACGGAFEDEGQTNTQGGTNSQGGSAGSATAGRGGGASGSAGLGGTAGTGTSGGAGLGGSAGTGTSGSAGMGMGGSAGTSAGGTGGTGGTDGCGGDCDFTCCDGKCVNTGNDLNNCGGCGEKCPEGQPFCDGEKCGPPPCLAQPICLGTQFCCGIACCDLGNLCCNIPGSVVMELSCVEPNDQGTCPTGCGSCVCASPDTPIATPEGERAIAELEPGDLVYSVDHGAIVSVPIVAVHKEPASGHAVPHLELENGRTLEISAGHPTADGRNFGELGRGDELGGLRIVRAHYVAYRHAFTHDILPKSSSGAYFAAGALIGSTLGGSFAECSAEQSSTFAPAR